MNVSVISWIWVSAWKMLTARPATSPKSSTGPARMSAISSAFRPSWSTVSGVIGPASLEAPYERADQQVPAVDEHEDHELERQRDEHRRLRDHAHRREDRGDHHVEDEERHVD